MTYYEGKYFTMFKEGDYLTIFLNENEEGLGRRIKAEHLPVIIRELLDAQAAPDSNLIAYANRELSLISPGDPMQDHMNAAILDLIKLFAGQGHSGMSAEYCIKYTMRLLGRKPLKPLWDTPEDWEPVGLVKEDALTLRHKRYSALFRSPDRPDHDVDACTFYVEGEDGTFTNGHLIDMYHKLRPISYPYTPPTIPAKVKCGRYDNGNAFIIKITEEAQR